jgi:hypothetical protein
MSEIPFKLFVNVTTFTKLFEGMNPLRGHCGMHITGHRLVTQILSLLGRLSSLEVSSFERCQVSSLERSCCYVAAQTNV